MDKAFLDTLHARSQSLNAIAMSLEQLALAFATTGNDTVADRLDEDARLIQEHVRLIMADYNRALSASVNASMRELGEVARTAIRASTQVRG